MTPDNTVKLRVGDVVRWEWVEDRTDPYQYWCCSRIAKAVPNLSTHEGDVALEDTYWSSGSDGKVFFEKDIGTKINIQRIANMDELEPCNKGKFTEYAAEDCIDLSHPNNSNYNVFFIRKGAKKDTGRMKRCLEAHIKYYQEKADYYNRTATGLQEDLDNFDEENPDNNYIPCDKNVWWE